MITRAQIPAEVDAVYQRELLYRATHMLVHDKWAKPFSIEENGGTNVMRFRRYANLAPATTPLTEGVTPAGSTISQSTITATVLQYGDFVEYSDKVTYESQDPLITEFAGILGDQAGETKDVLTRDVMNAGTQVIYCGGKTARNTIVATDAITYAELEKAEELLKEGRAKTITRMIGASGKISTSPVASAFIGLCTVNQTKQLQRLSQFVRVENYSSTMEVLEGEIGKV